jgi:hypothetical protein
MNKLMFVPLAFALLIPGTACAQDIAKPDAATQKHKSLRSSTKPITLSGMVGVEGKTFTTRKNDLWIVANPEALKNDEGHQVKIKCQRSPGPDTNQIQILSVKLIQGEVKYVANSGDAAFRR